MSQQVSPTTTTTTQTRRGSAIKSSDDAVVTLEDILIATDEACSAVEHLKALYNRSKERHAEVSDTLVPVINGLRRFRWYMNKPVYEQRETEFEEYRASKRQRTEKGVK